MGHHLWAKVCYQHKGSAPSPSPGITHQPPKKFAEPRSYSLGRCTAPILWSRMFGSGLGATVDPEAARMMRATKRLSSDVAADGEAS